MDTALLFRFDDFILDIDRRELRRGAEIVAVEPQVFDVLAFLIRMRDRVVSRDELLAEVWNGRIVSEATLSSRVNAARTALGDNGEQQRLIRTLPRKGVRFVGEVIEDTGEPTSSAAAAASPLPAIADLSIAVLPFNNMSADPDQDYFGDGIAEEIITALSRCSGLLVIARNSSFIYKNRPVDIREVGRTLGVGYVLEGSVRRAGERLRIIAQLIDARSGAHLWADKFDGDRSDVFDLQDRITERAVAAIEPTLHIAEIERHRHNSPNDADAYDLLLRASAQMHTFTPQSMTAALGFLHQALALDPSHARAMAAIAYCHAQRHFQGWIAHDDAHRREGLSFAQRAIERAPNDAQILWMAAFAIWNLAETQDAKDAAIALFSRSLSINPNSATALALAGWIEVMRGEQAAGRALLARAQRLNPLDPQGWFVAGALAIADIIDENYRGAIAWADKALLQNRRFAVALRALAVALVQNGEHERAARTVEELLAIEPELTVSAFFARIPVPVASMARTYAAALAAAGLPE